MRKLPIIFTVLVAFLSIAVVVRRLTTIPPQPLPLPPQEQPSETALFSDPIPQAEDVTTRGFQSGGLGLSRTAWETLRGKPRRAGEWFLYQGQTYSVFYQQGIIWQLKCTWKRPGLDLVQARARARRYLPLDSRRRQTLTSTAGTVVDQYFSQALGQRLAQPPTVTAQTQYSLEQQGAYTVTHTLEKDRVVATHFQIGGD